jgi:alpha-glucosidase
MTLDTDLYPDGVELATELEEKGIKWLAYFSTFVSTTSSLWDEAVAANVLIQTPDLEPYTFFGATLDKVSMVDLSTNNGRNWLQSFMQGALDLGFDGWMADYAEWLPADAVLASGEDAMAVHNRYPEWWQETNLEITSGTQASFFARSGWINSSNLAPVIWGGDQQTYFGTDDGLPTVLAMGLGTCTSGSPVFTHDIGGYSTIGVPFTDRELWFRWASLGAFTPIMRTHHGAWDTDNWNANSDEETWDYWTWLTREHTRLFPYRYGLAKKASEDGTPMILPISFISDSKDWGRTDAWMLGDSLLIAPIVEQGADSRYVDLPTDQSWVSWWTHEVASSGDYPAALDEINVFARGNTTIPTFDLIPDTLWSVADPETIDLDDADLSRTVYIFGNGSTFEEGDGTRYSPSGSASGPDSQTTTLTEGTIEAGGLQIHISGPIERRYTLVVVPMTL